MFNFLDSSVFLPLHYAHTLLFNFVIVFLWPIYVLRKYFYLQALPAQLKYLLSFLFSYFICSLSR